MTASEEPRGAKEAPQQTGSGPATVFRKLWLYTNFDCNLRCSYCVTESTPTASRRPLGLDNARQLVDEAVALGFDHVLFSGGEPFILEEIYDMLAYSASRVKTTVLTNGMLLRGKRLDRLCDIANGNLRVQVSLDGGCPEHHDPYRGQGTWAKTVEGIKLLQSRDVHVSISTTETPANSTHLDELHEFRRARGIPDEDHFVRPLARRGFSEEGLELGTHNLVPEVTVTIDGVYWHPLVSPSSDDTRVSEQVFPLSEAVERIQQELNDQESGGDEERTKFT